MRNDEGQTTFHHRSKTAKTPAALNLLMKVRQFRYCIREFNIYFFLDSLGLYMHPFLPEVCAFSHNYCRHHLLSCSFWRFTFQDHKRTKQNKKKEKVCMGFWSYLHLSLPPLWTVPVLIFSPVGKHKHIWEGTKMVASATGGADQRPIKQTWQGCLKVISEIGL